MAESFAFTRGEKYFLNIISSLILAGVIALTTAAFSFSNRLVAVESKLTVAIGDRYTLTMAQKDKEINALKRKLMQNQIDQIQDKIKTGKYNG